MWAWTFDLATGGVEVLTSQDRVIDTSALPKGDHADFTFEGLVSPDALSRTMDQQFPGWSNGTLAVSWTLAWGDGTVPSWVVESALPGGRSATAAFDAMAGDLLIKDVPPELDLPDLVLSDCTNFGGVFPVPMADAAAALPAGFEPVASANDPAGGATLYILFLDCEGSAVDGNDTGPVIVEYAELAVVPPAAYTLPGISDYTVPLAIGAGVDAVADRLAQFMLGHAGRPTVTDVTDGAPGPRRARMVVDDVTLDVTGQFAGDGSSLGDGGFALIGVQDGVVKTVVQGFSQGGSASQGTVTQQSAGLPVFQQARPLAVGFTVTGFTLTFTLAQTV